ncbi:MAG: hypothetical protein HY696_05715 [Deltaproteobacteria bacterium]|nr:hypothetical protein [Deltaproteobacteria bacterium]
MKTVLRAGSVLMLCGWVFGTVSAGSLSDLNREQFDQKFEVKETTPESPFVPKSVAKEELLVQDLQLNGVALGQSTGYALISGHVVRMGDRLAGYRVRYIGDDQVVLQRLDEQVVLRMQGGL